MTNMTIHLQECFEYLSSLPPKLTTAVTLNLKNFEVLLSHSYEPADDELLNQNATLIVNLLEQNETNSTCLDLSRAFFIVISHRWPDILEDFIECKIDENYWLYSLMNRLPDETKLMLYSGMISFFIKYQYNLSPEHCRKIDRKVIQEISNRLCNVRYIDIILCLTDTWTDLLVQRVVSRNEVDNMNILTTLLAVFITYWNHRLVHRTKVEPSVMKCLQFDWSLTSSKCVTDMIVFKYMMDVSWKVPFKYFICRYLLKFAIERGSLNQILEKIENELRDGFAKSLRNKNVVGIEMELFTFCLNHIMYEDWHRILHPVISTALLQSDWSSYFAKWWLPHIAKKHPLYVQSFDYLWNDSTSIHCKVRVAILKHCFSQNIPLTVTKTPQSLVNFLTSQFTVAEEIRGDVFALLCDFRDQSVLHDEQELQTILSFVKYNVNTNCTVLRHMMLSSFSRFVLRMICSIVRSIKKNEDIELNRYLVFLNDFNDFIADGLQPGCSYQRRITSLNLYKILMSYAVRECDHNIHKNNLKDADKFVKFAGDGGAWKFDDESNRKLLLNCLMDFCEEIQNVASLLLRNYFKLDGTPIENEIFAKALSLMNDHLFYKRNSGTVAIYGLIAMAYNSFEQPCRRMKINYSNFIEYFLNTLQTKVNDIKNDILYVAVNRPLDADIKLLNFLINDRTSPERNLVTNEHLERLIELLEVIVPLLLKALFVDKSSDYAPSFEESDRALRAIIENSVLADTIKFTDHDDCQLQPMNQLLLNFIWISLKVCSELESSLIENQASLDNQQIIRCGKLITSKLKYCRHKGVIEAAGVSLSNVVKTLTARGRCEDWLESEITDILRLIEFKSGATVSRKSAGLSLLIQNVVASDKRSNKPFFSKCWAEFRRILDIDYDSLIVDVSQETPQTHALHLSRVLAADTRNGTELLAYLEEITALCLITLKAPSWLIKNASLQLFGALLPKMVGKRNATPEIGFRCSFEEVFLPMPKILDHTMSTLTQAIRPQGSIQHADLAPILSILMNVQLTSVILMNDNLRDKVFKLRTLIEELLNSNLYMIREMASKALWNLYTPNDINFKRDEIFHKIVQYVKYRRYLQGENHLHGNLLSLKQAYDLYPQTKSNSRPITLQESLTVSLVSQALLFNIELVDVQTSWENLIDHITEVLNIVETNRYLSMGYDEWLHAILKTTLDQFEHVDVIRGCLKMHAIALAACLDVLCDRVTDQAVYSILFECLEEYLEGNNIDMIYHLLQTFTQLYKPEWKINCDTFMEKYFETLIELDYYRFQGSHIHFLGILAANSCYRIDDILRAIHRTVDMTVYNKKIRLNAAHSMLRMSKIIDKDNANVKLTWKILVDLSQDEEADIRFVGSESFMNMFRITEDLGPEITVEKLFDYEIVQRILTEQQFIDLLWDKLKISSYSYACMDEIRNPFDQGVINGYAENVKIVRLAGEAIKTLLRNNLSLCKEYFSIISFEKYFVSYSAKDISEYLISAEEYTHSLKIYYISFISQKIKSQCEPSDPLLKILELTL